MRGLRDTLVGWIDERMKNMLATPRAWGSDEAIEIQVLRLLEFRALVLLPELEAEAPGRLVDGYMAYLAKTYPAKPNRPLSQIIESDYLGQNLAAELRRAVDFLLKRCWTTSRVNNVALSPMGPRISSVTMNSMQRATVRSTLFEC